MEDQKSHSIFPMIVGGVLILALGGIIGAAIVSASPAEKKGDMTVDMLEKVRSDHKMTEIVRNKQVYDLEAALSQAEVDLGAASDMILKLQQDPGKVKYITIIKTQLLPGETKTVVIPIKDLPDEKLFSMKTPDGDLVVVRMQAKDTDTDGNKDAVFFDQYAQTFKLTATLSPKKSAFLLSATSDYDGKSHDIPVVANVIHVGDDEEKNAVIHLDVSMHMGGWAGANLVTGAPALGYQAGVSFPWLHPTPELDILSPEIGVGAAFYPENILDKALYSSPTAAPALTSSGNVRVGFDIASYNVGDRKTSILQDTWIGVDVTVGTDASIAGGITISSRL